MKIRNKELPVESYTASARKPNAEDALRTKRQDLRDDDIRRLYFQQNMSVKDIAPLFFTDDRHNEAAPVAGGSRRSQELDRKNDERFQRNCNRVRMILGLHDVQSGLE